MLAVNQKIKDIFLFQFSRIRQRQIRKRAADWESSSTGRATLRAWSTFNEERLRGFDNTVSTPNQVLPTVSTEETSRNRLHLKRGMATKTRQIVPATCGPCIFLSPPSQGTKCDPLSEANANWKASPQPSTSKAFVSGSLQATKWDPLLESNANWKAGNLSHVFYL